MQTTNGGPGSRLGRLLAFGCVLFTRGVEIPSAMRSRGMPGILVDINREPVAHADPDELIPSARCLRRLRGEWFGAWLDERELRVWKLP